MARNYTTEEITEDLKTHPEEMNKLFRYFFTQSRWGAGTPETVARARFDREIQLPIQQAAMITAYVPRYTIEQNQVRWVASQKKATAAGVVGLAAIVLGAVVDNHTSKLVLQAAGVGTLLADGVGLAVTYFRYKA